MSLTNLGIISLPFEVTTSFQKGTIHGPDTILNEIDHLDTFDFQLGRDPFEKIHRTTIRPHSSELVDSRIQQAVASRVVGEVLDSQGFPLCLGGEHTVSLGPIRAAKKRGPLGVVHLDAHADLRSSYEGNPLSHACVMRRVYEMECPSLSIGVRSMSKDEAFFANENNIQIISARQVIETNDWYLKLKDLPDRIYLTIDMDYFNPEDVPAVGTPEPGGPGWLTTITFLKYLFLQKNVVAADIVELMPSKNDSSSVRLAARLLGLLVGFRFDSELK